jgi:hypothetical protein
MNRSWEEKSVIGSEHVQRGRFVVTRGNETSRAVMAISFHIGTNAPQTHDCALAISLGQNL